MAKGDFQRFMKGKRHGHPSQRENAKSRDDRTFPHFATSIRNWLRQFTAIDELEQLSDRQLRDIGVERGDIERVAKRELARLHAADLITK